MLSIRIKVFAAVIPFMFCFCGLHAKLSPNAVSRVSCIVEKVIDGDTIIVRLNNRRETVRLLFIDAMENSSNSKLERDFRQYRKEGYYITKKDLQEMGRFAAIYLKKRLHKGTSIGLEIADNENRRDQYNRLLAVVYQNDKNINLELIQKGLARTYFMRQAQGPENYQKVFIQSENEAKSLNMGIWNTLNANKK